MYKTLLLNIFGGIWLTVILVCSLMSSLILRMTLFLLLGSHLYLISFPIHECLFRVQHSILMLQWPDTEQKHFKNFRQSSLMFRYRRALHPSLTGNFRSLILLFLISVPLWKWNVRDVKVEGMLSTAVPYNINGQKRPNALNEDSRIISLFTLGLQRRKRVTRTLWFPFL